VDRPASFVVVAFGITEIRFGELPNGSDLLVVHNDDQLPEFAVHVPGTTVRHLYPGGNVGFGAGVNAALSQIESNRTVLVNPDAVLTAQHFAALVDAKSNEIVTVPLVDTDGVPEGSVSAYPGPLATVLSVWRVGRWFPRNGAARRRLAQGSLAIGQADTRLGGKVVALTDRWVSGAVVSFPTGALRSVGGFDESYFLYVEDLDLSRRLAERFPDMTIRVADTPPALHAVGGTAHGGVMRRTVERHRATSWRTFARRNPGVGWRAAALLASLRVRTLS
jgi:N-acetylglucosaminyl-diphospho-decaprenol L-rhamnosyltransferase